MKQNNIPFKRKIHRYLFQKYKQTQTELHELTYLFWECTLRCNLSCLHCGSDCYTSSETKDMPHDDFLNVTQEIAQKFDAQKITVVITGGEPLMRNDLEMIGLQLRKQGFRWGIVSNALAMSQQRFTSLVAAGMGALTISFDGLQDDHNWLRNNTLSFQKTLFDIEMASKETRLNFDVVTCVNKRNISKLPEIKQILKEKGVKAWRLFTIAPIGRATENKDLLIDNSEFKTLMEFIKQARSDKEIKTSFSCEAYVGNYENEVRDAFFFCRAGINIGSVLVDGSISACPNVNHQFVQGNIYQNSFTEVWEEKFQKMRNRNWAKNGKCATCKQFEWCKGNGLHLRNEKEQLLRCYL